MNRIFASLCVLCAISHFASSPAAAVTIAWVRVGNPGNAPDLLTRAGAVGYAYNIDKYDVTNSQYAEFLNVKDPDGSNLLGLYDSRMGDPSTNTVSSGHGGIAFISSNPGGSKYVVISPNGNHPVNYVDWYDAIRFANWLNNGQGNGDTETGAYTLGLLGQNGVPINGNLITRNPNAKVFLPNRSEWYKAAYYDPRSTAQGGPPADSHYWLFPTASDTPPTAEIPPGNSDSANLSFAVSDLTDVGAYPGTMTHYGAFDMGGNVAQMNETLLAIGREVLGGDWQANSVAMESTSLGDAAVTPFFGGVGAGFRVASVATIPEPSSAVLASLACALLWSKRKPLLRIAN
jgi:formylglycine-generating enzyme required for sulfatase activity